MERRTDCPICGGPLFPYQPMRDANYSIGYCRVGCGGSRVYEKDEHGN